MPQLLSVTERNDSPSVDIGGSVGSGGTFLVQGIARAGTSSTGVGGWFQGTYGALLLNADGSYTYRLDNNDPDTNILGAGQAADDRFTYTYIQNGIVHTDTIVVRVSGIDEPAQNVTTGTSTITFPVDTTIDALRQFRMQTITGVIASVEENENHVFLNRGMIRDEAPTANGAMGLSAEVHAPWSGSLAVINYGLIEAHAGTTAHQAIGVGASGGATVENRGVIRAISDADPAGNYSEATGSGGTYIVNWGTIEAISTLDAGGVSPGKGLDNYGLIYAEGATKATGVGITQGAGTLINNDGTIWAVSRSAGINSYGIAMFRDSTNPYAYATVNNRGTIVADVAVLAYGTSVGGLTGIHVYNSGHVEGAFDMDLGLNMLINQAGGQWIGDIRGGINEEAIRNQGLIQGNVTLNAGNDLFDGRGGVQIGQVDGGDGFDVLLGGAGADNLAGGAGNDLIEGGGGADSLTGGSGADIFLYRSAGDSVAGAFDTINDFQSGTDKIDLGALAPTSVSLTASGGLTTVTAETATGTVTIRVNGSIAQSDFILGPKSATMTGTDAGEVIMAVVSGSHLNGQGGNDVLDGSSGNDVLDGGTGLDTMRGGAGDDIYYGDDYGDRVIEFDGEGIDELRTSSSARLQAYVENLTMLGSGDIFASGNRSANVITGNSGANDIFGDDGDDVLIGGGGGDSLRGGAGHDLYVYRAVTDSTASARDHIYFDGGEDRIDLRALNPTSVTWQETMLGYWQNFAISNIVTVQTAAGTLTIAVDGKLFASDFLLGGEIAGGNGDDSLMGTANGDVVLGGLGNDTLFGLAGTDTLSGQEGNDSLDGGPGADRMTGGLGDDIYYVDDSGDYVWEDAGDGQDTIIATASFILAARSGVEILRTGDDAGNAPINLTGNTFANTIYGNAGANILDGGVNTEDPFNYIPGGSDTLIGGAGNDTYYVKTYDTIVEADGGGFDTVYARTSFVLAAGVAVEVLALTAPSDSFGGGPFNLTGNEYGQTIIGDANANILDGGGGNDNLIGGAGNDRLIGGAGQDRLTGGDGADTFVFNLVTDSAVENIAADGTKALPDVILDFQSGQDKIDLALIDAIPGGPDNNIFSFIGNAAFTHHAGELRVEVRDGWSHVYADVNGDGLADMHIVVAAPSLQATDFIL